MLRITTEVGSPPSSIGSTLSSVATEEVHEYPTRATIATTAILVKTAKRKFRLDLLDGPEEGR
jgi:hypothetical protein